MTGAEWTGIISAGAGLTTAASLGFVAIYKAIMGVHELVNSRLTALVEKVGSEQFLKGIAEGVLKGIEQEHSRAISEQLAHAMGKAEAKAESVQKETQP